MHRHFKEIPHFVPEQKHEKDRDGWKLNTPKGQFSKSGIIFPTPEQDTESGAKDSWYSQGQHQSLCSHSDLVLERKNQHLQKELSNLRAERQQELQDLFDLEHVIVQFQENMRTLKVENKNLRQESFRQQQISAENMEVRTPTRRIQTLERILEKISSFAFSCRNSSCYQLQVAFQAWTSSKALVPICSRGGSSAELARFKYDLECAKKKSEDLQDELERVKKSFSNKIDSEIEQSARISQRLMKADDIVLLQQAEIAKLKNQIAALETKLSTGETSGRHHAAHDSENKFGDRALLHSVTCRALKIIVTRRNNQAIQVIMTFWKIYLGLQRKVSLAFSRLRKYRMQTTKRSIFTNWHHSLIQNPNSTDVKVGENISNAMQGLLERIAILEETRDLVLKENVRLVEIQERAVFQMQTTTLQEGQAISVLQREYLKALDSKLESAVQEKNQYLSYLNGLNELHHTISAFSEDILSLSPCPIFRSELCSLRLTFDPSSQIPKMMRMLKCCRRLIAKFRYDLSRFEKLFYKLLGIAESTVRNQCAPSGEKYCSNTAVACHDQNIVPSREDVLCIVDFLHSGHKNDSSTEKNCTAVLDGKDSPTLLSEFLSCSQHFRNRDTVFEQCRMYERMLSEAEEHIQALERQTKEDIRSKESTISSLSAKLTIAQDESIRMRRMCSGSEKLKEYDPNHTILHDSVFLLTSKLAKKNAEIYELERQIQQISRRQISPVLSNPLVTCESVLERPPSLPENKTRACFKLGSKDTKWTDTSHQSFLYDLCQITQVALPDMVITAVRESATIVQVDFLCNPTEVRRALDNDMEREDGLLPSSWRCFEVSVDETSSSESPLPLVIYDEEKTENCAESNQPNSVNLNSRQQESSTEPSQVEDLRSILLLISKSAFEAKVQACKYEANNENLKSLLELRSNEILMLKNSLDSLQQENRNLLDQNTLTTSSLHVLQSELKGLKCIEENLKKNLSASSVRILVLENQQKNLLDAHSRFSEELMALDAQVEVLEYFLFKCAVAVDGVNTVLKLLMTQRLARNRVLFQELTHMQTEILMSSREIEGFIQDLMVLIFQMEDAKQHSESKCMECASQFEEANVRWSIELQRLREENSIASSDVVSLRKQILDLVESSKMTKIEKDGVVVSLNRARSELSSIQSELNSLSNLCALMSNSVESLDAVHSTLPGAIDCIIHKYRAQYENIIEKIDVQGVSLIDLKQINETFGTLLIRERESKMHFQMAFFSLQSNLNSIHDGCSRGLKELLVLFQDLVTDLLESRSIIELSLTESDRQINLQIVLREAAESRVVEIQKAFEEVKKQSNYDSLRFAAIERELAMEREKILTLNMETERLLSYIQIKEDEIKELQILHRDMSTQFDEKHSFLDQRIANAALKISDLEIQIDELENSRQKLENELVFQSSAKDDLKLQVQDLQVSLREREKCLERYQTQEIFLESKLEDAYCLLDGRDDTIQYLSFQLHRSKSRIQHLTRADKQLEIETSLWEQKIESTCLKLENCLNQQFSIFRNVLTAFEHAKASSVKANSDLNLERNTHLNTMAQLDTLILEFECMKDDHAKFVLLASRYGDFAHKIESLCSGCLKELASILDGFQISVQITDLWIQQREKMLAEQTKLLERVSELEKVNENHMIALSAANQDIETIAMQLAEAVAFNLEATCKISDADAQILDLKRDLEIKSADFSKANSECQQLTALVGSLNKELFQNGEKLNQILEDFEIQSVQIQNKDRILIEKKEELFTAERKVKNLEVDSDRRERELNIRIHQLAKEVDEYKKSNKEASDEIEKCRLAFLAVQSTCQSLTEKITHLENEKSHLSGKLTEYDRILHLKGKEIARLHGNLAEANSLVADAEERISSIKKRELGHEHCNWRHPSMQAFRVLNIDTGTGNLCHYYKESEALLFQMEENMSNLSSLLNSIAAFHFNNVLLSSKPLRGDAGCLNSQKRFEMMQICSVCSQETPKKGASRIRAVENETSYLIVWRLDMLRSRRFWPLVKVVMDIVVFVTSHLKCPYRIFIESLLLSKSRKLAYGLLQVNQDAPSKVMKMITSAF